MDLTNFWFPSGTNQSEGGGGGGNDPGDPIGQSLRLRGAQYLRHTLPNTNQSSSWTWSCWVKFANPGNTSSDSQYIVAHADSAQYYTYVYRQSGNANASYAPLSIVTTNPGYTPTPNYPVGKQRRDPSAWYHVVWVHDTDANTLKTFVNGELNSDDTATNTSFNKGRITIGARDFDLAASTFFEGYMADVYFIDGQALDPTAFGRLNANGVWVPVKPSGLTYGANGFHLTFADPTDIGKDYSGNGNDFTATGFETTDTLSTDYDLMQDSPTQNFATLNPILMTSTLAAGTYQSMANLKHTSMSSNGTIKYGPTIQFPDRDQVFLALQLNVNSSWGTLLGFYKTINADYPDYVADRTTGLYGDGSWRVVINGTISNYVTWNAGDWLYFAYDRTNTRMRMWINDTNILDDSSIDDDYTCFYNI